MSVEAMRAKAHHSYRARLEVIIRIPTAVSDHDIHEMIKVGFPTYSLESLLEYCRASLLDCSSFISPVIPDVNISRGERLSENDSAHLFRVAHVVALAEVIFGNDSKARRWLAEPKEVFSGATPIAMLSTIQGAQKVEEMLIQAVEGFTF
ncbi:antitoxin Xre/MbcA/ParS toxin-binding domain-containing protein [Pseudomonas fluorescens]|uniref:antitoxin Xre/MbcA/ParS toxin-binding domain-containing protein n=1 Tax=Pseudomonas fluorescens TaxID=294 RepID=UPI0005FBC6B9|nr:antitoxin Xre/MbcA/ParS toxin-binding domain-containing protein [Pseudomonas fluorescens]KJZ35755.1 antitoxin [Pseudomonas fluorescens]